MNPFTKLPGFSRSPPGLERAILRRLPGVLALGTLASALTSLVARIFPWLGSAVEVATLITTIDIYGISRKLKRASSARRPGCRAVEYCDP